MRKILFILITYCVLLITPVKAYAIYDPLSVPNNKVGIHILFPGEIEEAARLVNENGDWGYVVIPIQAGDKDLDKWQKFMDDARRLHVIPIIRIATEGDYFNTEVWRAPNAADVLDFANFLHSLVWPVENQYVVFFNEVNRDDEWGGSPNPAAYADLLSYASIVFKNKSEHFFIIAAGLDNAAPNIAGKYINQYDFIRLVAAAVPDVFTHIDGFASHAYPNPGFSQPPSTLTRQSIVSFQFEKALLEEYAKKTLPVFITETGWRNDVVSNEIIGTYYTQAFTRVWNDPSIVVVAPFLLRAGTGPFQSFSFLPLEGGQTAAYTAIKTLKKTLGVPLVANDPRILGTYTTSPLPQREFNQADVLQNEPKEVPTSIKTLVKWLLKL